MSLLLLALFAIAGAQDETADPSSSECVARCFEQNRTCISEGENFGICGSCVEGFVEFGTRINTPTCIAIDSLSWESFLEEYQPVFRQDSNVTVIERLALLSQAAEFISQHNNNQTTSYKLGLTPYTVDSEIEYVQRSGYFYVPPSEGSEIEQYQPPTIASADLASSVDWVAKGGVTSVKNQGRCGSCWAISMCGAIEGAAYAQHQYLQSLSFQQFISCNSRNLGCDGGNLVIASLYSTLTDFGGISRMNDYEYTDFYGDTTEECMLSNQATPVAVETSKPQLVAGMTSGLSYDERAEQFKQVLEQQPIAMVIKSSCRTLSNYRSGILTDDGDCACNAPECLDHAVLMVGYDDSADIPYWKIKNSWGTGWGEDGYFRVAQTPAAGDFGLFGILAEGTIVQARNVTVQVEDEAQDVPFPVWAIVTIALGSFTFCLCLCCTCRWMRSGPEKENYIPEQHQREY
ncbi:cell surface protein [Nitzschia inconspicua]|uniref:Cell surface protein n=1 Tax=Nitzschia inconspicua TaxID=303405 RepID=A0A9K3LAW9_9STRA|nr:cell surface protein [Nitzschia inconspicua]